MKADLFSRSLAPCQVQAFRPPIAAPPPTGFRGGPVLGNTEGDRKLRHSRHWRPVDSFDPEVSTYLRLPGHYVYGGPIYDHFGHFMAEMAHRILPSLPACTDKPWLFIGTRNDRRMMDYRNTPRFFKETLGFFGIDPENVLIVTNDRLVDSLFVSEQGSDLGGGPKPGYLQDLRDFWSVRHGPIPTRQPGGRRIFVSRSDVAGGGMFLGETYLAECLEAEGFETYFPQNHSLQQQMDTYRSAALLLFSEGSACHGTELLGEAMLDRCCLLSRRSNHFQIFSRVLRPRSRAFFALQGNHSLGSMVGQPGEPPLAHADVALLDAPALAAWFRQHGIAELSAFDPATYLARAAEDLDAHIADCEANQRLSSPQDARNVMERLAVIRRGMLCG